MTAWLSFAMWLTLMPCGCRGGGGLKCAPVRPKRAKKKCVPTTFLKTAVDSGDYDKTTLCFDYIELDIVLFFLPQFTIYLL